MFSVKKAIATSICVLLPLTAVAADNAVPSTPVLLEKPSLVLGQSASTPAAKPVRIGYVDIARIGQESDYGKSVKAGLLDKKKTLEDKVLSKRKQLEKAKQSIEGKLQSMSPKLREAEAKKFQKKVEEFQKLAQNSEEEFMKLQESETGALFGAIEKTVAEYGKTTDLALVMVKKELLYLGSGVEPQDITDIILKNVDAGFKP